MLLMLEPELSLPFALFCLLCLSVLILIWYYLYYFARLAFYKPTSNPPAQGSGGQASNQLPPASIVICAKNEDHNLPEFLPLILSQDYPEYEVIVVDDCSWDTTPDVLRAFEEKHPRLKVITIKEEHKHHHGKKFALMVGIKGAQHEYLLLTDADCKPAGDQWLKKMMSGFVPGKEIVIGYSKYEKLSGLLNLLIRFDTFQIGLQYLSFALAGKPYMGVGRNLAYKKELFFRHKGFATHYHIESGDDDLFVNQAATPTNTITEFSPESFTVSKVKKTWKGWFEQKRRHLTTWRSYKSADKFRLGLYSAALVVFWLSFAVLASVQYEIYTVLAVFGLKIILQLVIFHFAMDKLKEKDLLLTSLLCELLLLAVYPALSFSNSSGRNKKWKRI